MDHPGRPGITRWVRPLGWVLSLVALGFVVHWLLKVDLNTWRSLRSANFWLLGLSLVIFQAWFSLRFLGWEWISTRYGLHDARGSNARMWTLSELLRYIPGNVWSFAARYRGARDRGVSRSGAVAAIVFEATFLFAGAAVVAVIFWRPNWWWLWAVCIVLLLYLLPAILGRVARWRGWETISIRPSTALKFLSLYVAVWAVYGFAQAVMLQAIPGLGLPNILMLAGANVTAWLIGYVSIIAPTGLGVREVALVGLLPTLTAEVASFAAVLTRLWLIISELVFLGIVFLIPHGRSNPQSS